MRLCCQLSPASSWSNLRPACSCWAEPDTATRATHEHSLPRWPSNRGTNPVSASAPYSETIHVSSVAFHVGCAKHTRFPVAHRSEFTSRHAHASYSQAAQAGAQGAHTASLKLVHADRWYHEEAGHAEQLKQAPAARSRYCPPRHTIANASTLSTPPAAPSTSYSTSTPSWDTSSATTGTCPTSTAPRLAFSRDTSRELTPATSNSTATLGTASATKSSVRNVACDSTANVRLLRFRSLTTSTPPTLSSTTSSTRTPGESSTSTSVANEACDSTSNGRLLRFLSLATSTPALSCTSRSTRTPGLSSTLTSVRNGACDSTNSVRLLRFRSSSVSFTHALSCTTSSTRTSARTVATTRRRPNGNLIPEDTHAARRAQHV